MSRAAYITLHSSAGEAGTPHPAVRIDWPTLALVIFLHACLLMALISASTASRPLALRPTVVSAFIELDQAKPAVEPPKTNQTRPRPAEVRQPTPLTVEQSQQQPDVPVAETPAEPPPSVDVAPQAAEAAEPPAIVPPRFDADYLDNPAPPYPKLSRLKGEQGLVLLRVYVGADGTPANIEIKRSSGYDRLDTTAQHTVGQWRFVPAREGARTIGGWVIVPISFKLRS